MVKIYIEGGGDSKSLRTECRKGFAAFFEKAGLAGKLPRLVACGGRNDAYDSFCTAIRNGESAFLLVDSEAKVSPEFQQGKSDTWQPWNHLAQRDKWKRPVGAGENQCHLMVIIMGSWFLAHRQTLEAFFGRGFQENKLPKANHPIEFLSKETVMDSLNKATEKTQKGKYGKGAHSFKILERLDATKVLKASPWAQRMISELKG